MRKTGLFFAALLLIAGLATAQNQKILSLEEAIRTGVETSRLLDASRTDVEAAAATRDEARANRLPSVRLSGGYNYLSSVPDFQIVLPPPISERFTLVPSLNNNYLVKLTTQQPVFTGFRLEKSEQVASLNLSASREDVSRDTNQVVYQVKIGYWSLYRANEARRVVDETVAQVQAHLADVRNMLSQGMATNNDVLRVETDLSSAQLLSIEAANRVRVAMMNLNNLLRMPLDTDIVLSTPLPPPEEVAPVEQLEQAALENRPEVKSLTLRSRAAKTAVDIARSGKYPQAFFSADYVYARPNPRIFPARNQFWSTWDFGVGVAFDIWNWRATDQQVRIASAGAQKTSDALETLKDSVRLQVREAYVNFTEAKDKIAVAAVGVNNATENLRVTKERFDEGLVLNSEVLDSEVKLLQARLEQSRALVDCELAKAAIRLAIGEQ